MKPVLKRIQTLDVHLPTEPGSLARIYGNFREAGVNVIAGWAYEMNPTDARAHFYVEDLEKTRMSAE